MNQITDHPLYRVHSIDTAMNSIWEFYRKRFVALFLMGLIFSLIIQYISSSINLTELQSITDINEMMNSMKDYLWPMIAVSLVSLLFTAILQYYVIYNPLDSEKNALRCAINSMRYYFPYLIIMVFLAIPGSFALFLGLIILVIGAAFAAIWIMMLYLFVLPVMMVEGPDIGNTIARTISLSHRSFWPNLGWTAVFLILLLVITFILSGLIVLPFTGSLFRTLTNPEEAAVISDLASKPLYIVLSALMNALTMPLLPIFAAVLYFNARAREQKATEWVPMEKEDNKVKVEDLYAKPLPEEDSK